MNCFIDAPNFYNYLFSSAIIEFCNLPGLLTECVPHSVVANVSQRSWTTSDQLCCLVKEEKKLNNKKKNCKQQNMNFFSPPAEKSPCTVKVVKGCVIWTVPGTGLCVICHVWVPQIGNRKFDRSSVTLDFPLSLKQSLCSLYLLLAVQCGD